MIRNLIADDVRLYREGLLRVAARPRRAKITAREHDIVALIDDGLSNKEIAARLHVELATVKNHVHNILDKLHIHRRGEISARLRAEGRVDPTCGEPSQPQP